MNHLSLFNGIGGCQLAAHWCGWNNVAHVEIDDYCNRVVARHFPKSVCHTEIKQFDGTQYRGKVDIISGGFPCQPYSLAGKRLGKKDDRALWPEMLRVIDEVRPTWVVGENVAGILSMGIEHYLADLEVAGYEVQAFVIPACAVNAPHRRDRVWIVAHCSKRYDRRSIGNPEKGQVQKSRNCDEPRTDPDTNRARPQGWNERGERAGKRLAWPSDSKCWEESWRNVALRTCLRRVDDGLSGRMDRAGGVPGKSKAKTAAGRVLRLKALGNAIVPQVAYEIFKAIEAVR